MPRLCDLYPLPMGITSYFPSTRKIRHFSHNFAANANQHLIQLISLDLVSVHTRPKYHYGISTTFPSDI